MNETKQIELESLDEKFLDYYKQYEGTRMHPMYEWSRGRIDWKEQIDKISKEIEEQSLIFFIEKEYDIALTDWQKAIVLKLQKQENPSLYTKGKHIKNKFLLEGVKRYKQIIN